jgi:type IVB pilus formation R64 PilN family outer membrane protein
MATSKTALLPLTAFLAGLGGCVTADRHTAAVDVQATQVRSRADALRSADTARAALAAQHAAVRRVQGAWLGAATVPVDHAQDLPPVFDRHVTLIFPDRASLATIAQRITLVTGVPVRIQPDVFIRVAQLVPSGGAMAPGLPPGVPNTTPPLPTPIGAASLAATSTSLGDFDTSMTLEHRGSLATLLDTVAARGGINWEYRNGAIYFYRLASRTFSFRAIPGIATADSSVGKSASTSAGNTGGGTTSTSGAFTGASASGATVKSDAWASIEASIKAVLSPVGKVAVSQATGSITVTDQKDYVDRVARLIEHENRMLSRQVVLKAEILSVTLTDNAEYGIDWEAVFNRLSSIAPSFTVSYTSPLTILSNNAAQIGYAAHHGQASGSSALIRALNDLGKVASVQTGTSSSGHNQPGALAITNQDSYLARITPAPGGLAGAAGGIPGLEPGQATTGFFLNWVPSITENDHILLQFNLDISELVKLGVIGSGDQQIQTPNISGIQGVNRASIRSGDTIVFQAFERDRAKVNRRTLADGAPLAAGGSFAGAQSKEFILVVLTPRIVEGSI